MRNFLTGDDKMFLDIMQKASERKAGAEEKDMARLALQGFVQEPVIEKRRIQALQKQLQAVSVSTDFDLLTTNAFNVTIEEDNFDMGWERAFKEVPRDADKDFWELGTIKNGITFKRVLEGERIEVGTVTGEKVNIYVHKFGGALGFTYEAMKYRKLAQMLDAASAFRNKFYVNKAANHYLLIAFAAVHNNAGAAKAAIPWQGVAGDARVQRDILTINRTAFVIGNANKDKGYGDMANAPLIIYANPNDKERIKAALRVTDAALTQGGQAGTSITDQPIQTIFTYDSNFTSGSPVMVLPGRKMQRNDAMMPTTYVAPTDVLTLNEVQAVWAEYGAGIGDADQVYQFTLG